MHCSVHFFSIHNIIIYHFMLNATEQIYQQMTIILSWEASDISKKFDWTSEGKKREKLWRIKIYNGIMYMKNNSHALHYFMQHHYFYLFIHLIPLKLLFDMNTGHNVHKKNDDIFIELFNCFISSLVNFFACLPNRPIHICDSLIRNWNENEFLSTEIFVQTLFWIS